MTSIGTKDFLKGKVGFGIDEAHGLKSLTAIVFSIYLKRKRPRD